MLTVESAAGAATADLPPGTFGAPMVGELREFTPDPRAFIWERYRRYGRIFRSHLGHPIVFMMGPAANKAFLQTYNERLTWGKALPVHIQKMLTSARDPDTAPSPAGTFALEDGEAMRRMKQIASTAFHPGQLASTVLSMTSCMGDAFDEWCRHDKIEFYEACKLLLFRTIWAWVTGAHEDPQRREIIERVYTKFTEIAQIDKDEDRGKVLIAKHIARRSMEKYIAKLVAERKEMPLDDVLSTWAHKTDKEGGHFTERQMVAHAILFMITGDEATAITLCWVLLALHQFPESAERLHEEIDRVVGDEPFAFGHLRQLPYTTCFLKEVERVYSPAFGPKRYVLEEFEFDGYRIPAGWHLRLCNFVSHCMPDAFEEPERFDPDRFAPPREEDKKTPYSLVGFGGGPRICIGRPFSMLAMAAFLVQLVRRFDFDVIEGQDLSPLLVRNALFVPNSGLEIRLRRRQAAT